MCGVDSTFSGKEMDLSITNSPASFIAVGLEFVPALLIRVSDCFTNKKTESPHYLAYIWRPTYEVLMLRMSIRDDDRRFDPCTRRTCQTSEIRMRSCHHLINLYLFGRHSHGRLTLPQKRPMVHLFSATHYSAVTTAKGQTRTYNGI